MLYKTRSNFVDMCGPRGLFFDQNRQTKTCDLSVSPRRLKYLLCNRYLYLSWNVLHYPQFPLWPHTPSCRFPIFSQSPHQSSLLCLCQLRGKLHSLPSILTYFLSCAKIIFLKDFRCLYCRSLNIHSTSFCYYVHEIRT